MKKTLNILVLLLLFSFLYSFSPSDASDKHQPHINNPIIVKNEHKDKEIDHNGYQIKTIVLDPGHGGKDAGCSGKHSKEKHIALNMVLTLGKIIEKEFPNINVIYTRKTDVFVPLYKRAAIANKNNADLFISVHCNALSHKPHLVWGSETYVMGLHTAEHNLDVARRENESILLEDNYEKNYQGFDPNSDEGHIFLTMFQNAFLEKSIQFAEKVELKIKTSAKRKSRGVKQAGFVVLKETTMPSVLIETGYLSHANDEAFLSTNNGQTKIANAIFEAFKEYKAEVEKQPTVDYAINEAQPIISEYIPAKLPQEVIKPKVIDVKPKAIPTSLKVEEKEMAGNAIVDNAPPKAVEIFPIEKSAIIFKVQLAASPVEIETSNKKWSKIQFVEVRKEKNLYKYLTGSHESYATAVHDRNNALAKGFNGAFVVAYKDGERIPLKLARSQEK